MRSNLLVGVGSVLIVVLGCAPTRMTVTSNWVEGEQAAARSRSYLLHTDEDTTLRAKRVLRALERELPAQGIVVSRDATKPEGVVTVAESMTPYTGTYTTTESITSTQTTWIDSNPITSTTVTQIPVTRSYQGTTLSLVIALFRPEDMAPDGPGGWHKVWTGTVAGEQDDLDERLDAWIRALVQRLPTDFEGLVEAPED